MKEKNSYSRLIQGVSGWDAFKKGHIIALLDQCVEHNITSFDNANFFGKKYADHIFGVALSETGFEREEIQLISKFSQTQNPETSLVNTIDELLLRLKTDYLDLILLDPSDGLPELMEEVFQLLSQGKIKEIGGVNLEKEEIKRMEECVPVRANQMEFSAGFTEVANKLKHMNLEETSPFIWYYPKGTSDEKKRNLEAIGSKYNFDKNELVLAWLLSHPAHLHPVIHFSEEDKITRAVKLKDSYINPVDWQKIEALLTS
ncbi:MAG TPA: aldo/keto reductase [Salinimicrobium sp.]|nr:aldo/keto reductase [Salinimicrobium sp.]